MKEEHGFSIYEDKYNNDVEGLLNYLSEKIHKGLICLYCNNKGTRDFKTPESVKQHMMDKGHCFMDTENFEEYIKYYDFSE